MMYRNVFFFTGRKKNRWFNWLLISKNTDDFLTKRSGTDVPLILMITKTSVFSYLQQNQHSSNINYGPN